MENITGRMKANRVSVRRAKGSFVLRFNGVRMIVSERSAIKLHRQLDEKL